MTIEVYEGFNRKITIDNSRDSKLTTFAKVSLQDRYLWTGETYQRMFARVACVNSDNDQHAQRLYDYISMLWFMPATPVLSNSGSKKNLTISCYLNSVGDSLEEIFETQVENKWLASRGGGIGTHWGEVRSVGEPVGGEDETGKVGETSGVIPFIVSTGSDCLAISQGNLRRGSAAFYLDVSHPEIMEFLDLRNPSGGGAAERKSLHAHHGVIVPDAFIEAVKKGLDWNLISPYTGKVMEVISARSIWEKIIARRMSTGEPYIWFVDNVNRQRPENYVKNELYNTTSNLCSEITETTSIDYNGKRRTAVCCLSSLNLETYDQWEGNEQFIEDVLRFLDNNMSHFIANTDGVAGFERARYSAEMERSIGLGVMGFHGLLQSKKIPFEGAMAKVWNLKIFQWLHTTATRINITLGGERGPCPDSVEAGTPYRFTHMFAIAPTASISVICGEASPGIEPFNTNIYKQKTLSGSFIVKNKMLNAVLKSKYIELHGIDGFGTEEYNAKQKSWLDAQWNYITENEYGKGTVRGLSYLTDLEKDVFKTAFEIKQEWIIEHAGDRQPYICQGQSLNIFLVPTTDKKLINKLLFMAHAKGIKGLYYNRSRSTITATNVQGEMPQAIKQPEVEYHEKREGLTEVIFENEVDDCLACQ